MKSLWVILFVLPLFGQKPLKYSISLPEINQSNMPVLFLMHGYGSNEKQFNELIEVLDNKYLIVSMRAPFKFMVVTNRWYEYGISDGDTLSNQAQIDVSTNRIIKTIEHIKGKYNIDEKKIFIGGFSQGAIISYKLALLYPSKFEGIFIHSARLPVEYSVKEPSLYKNLNILIIHGSEDSGLSTKWAYQGKALFEKLGAKTDYYEAKIGHEMNEITYSKIKQWLFSLVDE
tara:strand:+ start:98 stop:787 length:690 start_codon:yes stop_codon:yes gene_type:complete